MSTVENSCIQFFGIFYFSLKIKDNILSSLLVGIKQTKGLKVQGTPPCIAFAWSVLQTSLVSGRKFTASAVLSEVAKQHGVVNDRSTRAVF